MALPNHNRRILLAAVPQGMPQEQDFLLTEEGIPTCPDGGVLLKTLWISVDPYLRGRISGVRTYIDPIPTGSVMESGAVGEVVESRCDALPPGSVVSGHWGWQEYAALGGASVQPLDPDETPVSTALGVLGMPGLTAYFGLTELCAPRPGETVLVSGAAGAVGSAAGQIAKILGCRVAGTAGSDAKVQRLKELGFDDAFNYRTAQPYSEALARLCPAGIDCYFDNVGGPLTDAVLPRMNLRGRIAVCGAISQYNDRSQDIGPRPYAPIIVRQLRVEGFIVTRFAARFAEGRRQMTEWYKQGLLRYDETIYEGLESAPRAFIGLFHGENTGKALVRL